MKPIHVLVAADRQFVWGCAVSVRSLLDNTRTDRPIDLFVAHDSLRPDDQRALLASWDRAGGRVFKCAFVLVPQERVGGLIRSKAVSRMTYARLFIGDLLPTDADRCVYVDSDVVFQRDVEDLVSIDLDGKLLGAVPNGVDNEAHDCKRLGLPIGQRYFNAGVMVVDLGRWRELDFGRVALEICRTRGPSFGIPDQDSINIALAGDWAPLPMQWNSWASRTNEAEGRVVHYTQVPKPWDCDYQGRFPELFFRYLDRTAFSGQRPLRAFGLAPLVRRIRRRIPYWPTVWRMLKQVMTG